MRKLILSAAVVAMTLLPAGVANASESGASEAARLIVQRYDAHLPMSVDLTWRGAPDVVGDYNEQLADEAFAHGKKTTKGLIKYLRTRS